MDRDSLDDDPDPPRLTDEQLDDDAVLGEVIDAVLDQDPLARERDAEIAMHHTWLAGMIESGAWQMFIRIEELTNARNSDALVVVARWAYGEGQRSAAGRPS